MTLMMSPWPRIRWAMRSGWNSSRASSFSPTPTNLIGTWVTSLMDRAAPPRASPSSLVRMTPFRSRASLNALALLTASCPVMASQTKKTSSGLTSRSICLSSSIGISATCSRPAVSRMTVSCKVFLGLGDGVLADGDRGRPLAVGMRPLRCRRRCRAAGPAPSAAPRRRVAASRPPPASASCRTCRAAAWRACRPWSFCRYLAGRRA